MKPQEIKTMHTPENAMPKLLAMLLRTPLFDENSEDQSGGGLEEIARDLSVPETDVQEDLAEAIYQKIKTACNAHEDLLWAVDRLYKGKRDLTLAEHERIQEALAKARS